MSNLQGAFLLHSGKQIVILCVNFADVKYNKMASSYWFEYAQGDISGV